MKRLTGITLSVPKIFVYNECFFLAEMRNNHMNLINQWNPCIVQLSRYQIRIYRSLADIAQENTIQRVNLNHLMVSQQMKLVCRC